MGVNVASRRKTEPLIDVGAVQFHGGAGAHVEGDLQVWGRRDGSRPLGGGGGERGRWWGRNGIDQRKRDGETLERRVVKKIWGKVLTRMGCADDDSRTHSETKGVPTETSLEKKSRPNVEEKGVGAGNPS